MGESSDGMGESSSERVRGVYLVCGGHDGTEQDWRQCRDLRVAHDGGEVFERFFPGLANLRVRVREGFGELGEDQRKARHQLARSTVHLRG